MNKITFENLPSANTPINATNLNQLQTNIEDAIDGKMNKEVVVWEGNSQGGDVINVNVSQYNRLKVKVRLSAFITFLEIDLTEQTSGVVKNSIAYKYGNAIVAGALDGTQYINKCVVAVSEDKTKVLGYDFGYASLSTTWNFQNRDQGGTTWAILQIIGLK